MFGTTERFKAANLMRPADWFVRFGELINSNSQIKENTMIATLNKSKTALTINRQEFKLALAKMGEDIEKQIVKLKKARHSYDAGEMAREMIAEANIFEAIIEGFNEAEETNLKLTDITNLEAAQGWIDEFLEKYSEL